MYEYNEESNLTYTTNKEIGCGSFGTVYLATISETGEQVAIKKVFQDMLLVFTNFKFISFLIIFSGLWLMFWQIFYLLPFYATDYLQFEDFELLETVDAVGIIFFTMPRWIIAAFLRMTLAI